MTRERIAAQLWALKFDRDQLKSSASHYARAGMWKSYTADIKAAQALQDAINKLETELQILEDLNKDNLNGSNAR